MNNKDYWDQVWAELWSILGVIFLGFKLGLVNARVRRQEDNLNTITGLISARQIEHNMHLNDPGNHQNFDLNSPYLNTGYIDYVHHQPL